jgi:pyrimidine-nucleoside phosphorylase
MVAGHMARLAGKSQESDLSDILPQLEEKLGNGDAWKVFRTMVESQGGDIAQIDHPEMLPTAPVIHEVKAIESGTLSEVNAREIGLAALDLGAGRLKKGDPIDHSVGIVVHYKVGQEVETGAVLATIHARTEEAASLAATRTLEAHHYSSDVRPLPIFYDVITSTGT